MPRLPLAALAGALTLLLAPAAAHADDYVANFSLAPTDTAAGKHSQVDMHAEFSRDDPVRDLRIHLPPGLVGNPTAVPACPRSSFDAGSCPANTAVGTTSVDTITTILLVPTPVTASGSLYNVEPGPNEPARLGAIVEASLPAVGSVAKIVLPVTVSMRPDGGLDTAINGIPETAGGFPTVVTAIDLHLGDVAPTFMSNPTSCRTATTTIEATTRSDVTHTAASSFTPTHCDALQFQPKLTATIEARGPKGARNRPAFTTVITTPAGQSSTKTTTVTLSKRMGVDATHLGAVCTLEQAAADACPDDTAVGSVSAATPLLPIPLSGPVYMASLPNAFLPGLRLALGGPVSLRFSGALDFTPQGVSTTFDGLPDVPLSRLTLGFKPGGPLRVLGDPCTGSLLRMTSTLTGHNGATVTSPARVRVLHCPLRVDRKRNSLRVRKGRDAARLRRLTIVLPKRAKRAAVTVDGKKRTVRVHGRTISLRLSGAGDVVVRVAGVRRGTTKVTATRTNGKRATVRLR